MAAAVGQGSIGRTRGIPQNDSSLSYDTEYLALWRAWFLASLPISGPLLFWASLSPSYVFQVQQTFIVSNLACLILGEGNTEVSMLLGHEARGY